MEIYTIRTISHLILKDEEILRNELLEKFNIDFINFARKLRLLRMFSAPLSLEEQTTLTKELQAILKLHNTILTPPSEEEEM